MEKIIKTIPEQEDDKKIARIALEAIIKKNTIEEVIKDYESYPNSSDVMKEILKVLTINEVAEILYPERVYSNELSGFIQQNEIHVSDNFVGFVVEKVLNAEDGVLKISIHNQDDRGEGKLGSELSFLELDFGKKPKEVGNSQLIKEIKVLIERMINQQWLKKYKDIILSATYES